MKKFNPIFAKLIFNIWPLGIFPFAKCAICLIFASLIGYSINVFIGSETTLLIAIVFGLVGWFSSNPYIKNLDNKDPGEVVIDKFSGQLITTSANGNLSLFNILAFNLFRVLNILKPGIIQNKEKLREQLL